MGKRIAMLFICSVFLFSIAGCGSKNRSEHYLRKTSLQIEEEFGAFDCCGMQADADGLYRNTACGYTIKEARVGFLGTEPEILIFITFDETGKAIACETGYRPGN